MIDAATVIHVCEKGHADDHHIGIPDGDGQERCSRCGGKTFPIRLDALARFAIERERLLQAIDGEIVYLERKAERNKALVHQENAHRLQQKRDEARIY